MAAPHLLVACVSRVRATMVGSIREKRDAQILFGSFSFLLRLESGNRESNR